VLAAPAQRANRPPQHGPAPRPAPIPQLSRHRAAPGQPRPPHHAAALAPPLPRPAGATYKRQRLRGPRDETSRRSKEAQQPKEGKRERFKKERVRRPPAADLDVVVVPIFWNMKVGALGLAWGCWLARSAGRPRAQGWGLALVRLRAAGGLLLRVGRRAAGSKVQQPPAADCWPTAADCCPAGDGARRDL
jgi:hypothetical protein